MDNRDNILFELGLSMQTVDPTKPTNPTRTDPSWLDLKPPPVGDRSEPSETDSGGGLVAGFILKNPSHLTYPTNTQRRPKIT